MEILTIGEHKIGLNSAVQIDLPVAKLYTNTDISMPIFVIRGRSDGPAIFVSAAIHGDELNGIEIIRRLITRKNFKLKQGTLIAVPMVNVYGVVSQSRYFPDRRDLNRSFPGSPSGSLAGRFASQFLTEIVSQCHYGIDLHTGALHRSNLPQIRGDLSNNENLALAKIFGAPVAIDSTIRDGSLRQAAQENGIHILVYEGGEALRFDELSIQLGLKGILNVLAHLEMIKPRKVKPKEPFIADRSVWIRAPSSGIVHEVKKLGDHVRRDELLAEIGDPFGHILDRVYASFSGVIIGKQNIPLVQEGDAMYHIAYFKQPGEVVEHIETIQDALNPHSSE